jgi:hypothetical protein
LPPVAVRDINLAVRDINLAVRDINLAVRDINLVVRDTPAAWSRDLRGSAGAGKATPCRCVGPVVRMNAHGETS